MIRRNTFLCLPILLTFYLIFLPLTNHAEMNLDVKEYVLKNGLKVLILERDTSQTVAVKICFKVGSVNEHPGITGLSHLLEHMLFKGTKTIGTRDYEKEKPLLDKIDEIVTRLDSFRIKKMQRGRDYLPMEAEEVKGLKAEFEDLVKLQRQYAVVKEISQIYQRHGAQGLNASTSTSMTGYYCDLPSHKLELWAWLESDRMSNPVLRGFYQERDVILEERRQRLEDNPGGSLYALFQSTIYQAHPLRWPVIGWRSDIQFLKKDQAYQYFRRYYAPNNAVVVIVGNVKADEVVGLMRKYFEPIPAQEPPPPLTTFESVQKGERRVFLEFDAEPRILIGFHTVKIGDKDDYVFDLISGIMSSGRTSRLYKKLVLEQQLCLNVNTGNGAGKYAGEFTISASPKHPHTTEEVEAAIYAELDLLKKEPVTPQEINRAKKQLEGYSLRALRSNSGMAARLGHCEVMISWRYILSILNNYHTITPEDIMAAAKKYLVPGNRTVAILVKKEKPAENNKEE